MSEMMAMRSPLSSFGRLLSEISRCWITSRLGSMKKAHRATAASSTGIAASETRTRFFHFGVRPHSRGPGGRRSSWIRKKSSPRKMATAITKEIVTGSIYASGYQPVPLCHRAQLTRRENRVWCGHQSESVHGRQGGDERLELMLHKYLRLVQSASRWPKENRWR